MTAFDAFRAGFVVTDRVEGEPPTTPTDLDAELVNGYAELMSELAGSSFNNGLYRLHTKASSDRVRSAVRQAFPSIDGAIFGFDWLGRQFLLSRTGILLAEPGTGQILEIPSTFREFHDVELVEYSDSALAASFFAAWRRSSAGEDPLTFIQCAGYRVPLFLGGRDVLENLELVDVELYWDITAELISQVRRLPPGTPVRRASINDQSKES